MAFTKKDAKKIERATREELDKLHEEYKAVMENVSEMSPASLLIVSAVGILVVLAFQSSLLDLIGLILLLYPLYIFVRRGAHRKGYFEGYYEMMTKVTSPPLHVDSPESHGHDSRDHSSKS